MENIPDWAENKYAGIYIGMWGLKGELNNRLLNVGYKLIIMTTMYMYILGKIVGERAPRRLSSRTSGSGRVTVLEFLNSALI